MRGSWLRQNEQVQVRNGFCSGGFESRRATWMLPQWHPPAWSMIVSFVSIAGKPAARRAVGRSLSARFGDGDARHRGSGHEFQSASDLVDGFAVAMEAEPDEVELGG